MATEDGFDVLATRLGAIARQLENNGPGMGESWVAEHHDEEETRELLVIAVITFMERTRQLEEASSE
jgi:hypothetical protein